MRLSEATIRAIVIGALTGLIVIWLAPIAKRLPPRERTNQ